MEERTPPEDTVDLRAAQGPDARHAVRGWVNTARNACTVLRGTEATEWLHRISSNEIRKLPPGRSCTNLMLDERGKILCEFLTVREDDQHFLLFTEPSQQAVLRERLEFYHFAEDVTFGDPESPFASLLILGPEAPAIVARALELPDDLDFEPGLARTDHVIIAPERRLTIRGIHVFVQASDLQELRSALADLAAHETGAEVFEALRIESGLVDFSHELARGVLPHEARMEQSFDLDKGCYPGQETVARMDSYGGPQKKLFGFALADRTPILEGTISQEGQKAGELTSGTFSVWRDHAVALGYVRKAFWNTGQTFTLTSASGATDTATLVDLPFPA